ncbi:uncharacterized protein IWZ02DRAFT_4579 [Phyllosticta citriasiana]|uniref:uncharacterized protein n=1 Tax=Phyllosticta citriasiana TaxID=595635 RepID=UPI0030FD2417
MLPCRRTRPTSTATIVMLSETSLPRHPRSLRAGCILSAATAAPRLPASAARRTRSSSLYAPLTKSVLKTALRSRSKPKRRLPSARPTFRGILGLAKKKFTCRRRLAARSTTPAPSAALAVSGPPPSSSTASVRDFASAASPFPLLPRWPRLRRLSLYDILAGSVD